MATVTEEIDLPVNTNADEAAGEFKNLRTQIRETTVALQALEAQGKTNTAEFEALRKKLDDLNDTADVAAFRAGQLDDRLAALPGVAGQAGQAFKSFNDTLKLLATNPILLTITLVVGALVAMKKALESTAEGQATLNKLSTAFDKILGPILAIIETVAVPLFNTLADILVKVGDGFAWFAEKLGISKEKIAEASSGIEDFKKQNQDFLKQMQAMQDEADRLALKKQADRDRLALLQDKKTKDEEIKQSTFLASQKAKLTAENNDLYLAKLKELNKKILEEERKLAEERKKATIDQIKSALDASIAVNLAEIDARKKRGEITIEEERQLTDDIFKVRIIAAKKLNAEEEKLAKEQLDAGKISDLQYKALQKQNNAEILLLGQQRAEKAYDITKEGLNKIAELQNFAAIEEFEGRVTELDKLSAEKDFDFQADIARENERLALQKEIYDKQLALLKDNTIEKAKLQSDYVKETQATQKKITQIEKDEQEYRYQIAFKYADLTMQIGKLISSVAGENKQLALLGLQIESASALATIGISTYKNAAKAGFTTPMGIAEIAAGIVAAAAVVVSYNKGVQEINKVPTPGGGSGGGASAPSIAPPTITAPEVNLFTATQQGTTAGIVAGAISSNNSADRPMKVYVTSNDVTSTQELDRKALNLARL